MSMNSSESENPISPAKGQRDNEKSSSNSSAVDRTPFRVIDTNSSSPMPRPSPKKRPAPMAQSSDCPDKTKKAKLDDASTPAEPFPNGGFDFINDGFDQFANGGFPREELSPTFCNWAFGELAPTKCIFCIAKDEEEGKEVEEEEEEEEDEKKN